MELRTSFFFFLPAFSPYVLNRFAWFLALAKFVLNRYSRSDLALQHSQMVAKRRIAVIRSLPSSDPRGGLEKTAEALVAYLDVFYADTEAWQELANVYTELNL